MPHLRSLSKSSRPSSPLPVVKVTMPSRRDKVEVGKTTKTREAPEDKRLLLVSVVLEVAKAVKLSASLRLIADVTKIKNKENESEKANELKFCYHLLYIGSLIKLSELL